MREELCRQPVTLSGEDPIDAQRSSTHEALTADNFERCPAAGRTDSRR